MIEVWVEIRRNKKTIYEISNMGRLRSITMLGSLHKQGYLRSTFGKKRKAVMIHRLVAEAFIPNPHNKPFVNHKNCNKADNRAENLEWCTEKENSSHASVNGRYKNNGKAKSKKVYQYDLTGNLIAIWSSAREIQRVLGYTQSSVQQCCLRKWSKYKGYAWSYVELTFKTEIAEKYFK